MKLAPGAYIVGLFCTCSESQVLTECPGVDLAAMDGVAVCDAASGFACLSPSDCGGNACCVFLNDSLNWHDAPRCQEANFQCALEDHYEQASLATVLCRNRLDCGGRLPDCCSVVIGGAELHYCDSKERGTGGPMNCE